MKLARRLECWQKNTVDAETRGKTGARGFEMDITRGDIVRVANNQADVPDHRRLICEISYVGREIVARAIGPCELDVPLGARRESFD